MAYYSNGHKKQHAAINVPDPKETKYIFPCDFTCK